MSKKEIRLSVSELEKLGLTIIFPQYKDAKAEENSRRLAACWNACEGISTENLEDNKPIIELANDYNAVLKQRDELLKQRDELLAALVAVFPYCDRLSTGIHDAVRDAIARVKGGAA